MRYSISNAIPHNPKSENRPYETLANTPFLGVFSLPKTLMPLSLWIGAEILKFLLTTEEYNAII